MVQLLSTEQMAEFANSGCLFFDGLIDNETNKEILRKLIDNKESNFVRTDYYL